MNELKVYPPCRRSKLPLLSLALLLMLQSSWFSANGASSNVVGWYSVAVPSGNSSWTCGLVCADLYQGSAVTVTADVDGKALVTFSSPGWTDGAFSKHYAEPLSGASAGLAIDVLSNTVDTLKLNATPAAAGLSNGMVFVLRKHATLAGLLPDGGGFVAYNDTISLFGTGGSQSLYFWNATNWITASNTDASEVIIRPGQGFVIQVGVAKTLTIGKGEVAYVKTTPTKIQASSGTPNLVGALNPLGTSTTLGSLGITSSLQPFNDSVVMLNPGSLAQTGTFLTDGTNLLDANFQNANNTALPAGTSVVINVDGSKTISLTPVTVSP